jgi:hypothetical protein
VSAATDTSRSRFVVAAFPLALGSLLPSCTMLASEDRFVPARVEAPGLKIELHDRASWHAGGGLRIGGSPGVLALESKAVRIEVSSPSFSWDQDWIGPVLPVFPVVMGASSYRSRVAIHLHVDRAPCAVSLRPEDFQLLRPEERASVAPVAYDLRPKPEQDLGQQPLEAGAEVILEPGRAVWLVYPADNLSTRSFELRFPVETSQATQTVTVRFEREATPYLLFIPWPG